MRLEGKVVVVTGAASGIGRALCERFAAEGVAGLAAADVDAAGCASVAADVGDGQRGRPAGAGTAGAAAGRGRPRGGATSAGRVVHAIAVPTDVRREDQVVALIERAESELGPIDLYCSNAGISVAGGVEVADEEWQRVWSVNVMAHVYAARALVPRMTGRGGGHLLVTASAAGLLTNLGTAPYTVTKHAAVALAEWLAITHGDDGVAVSCLCPQGVRTPLLLGGVAAGEPSAAAVLAAGEVADPADVADAVVRGLDDERFLILPHPQVAEYVRHRAEDPERWLRAMRRQWAGLRRSGQGSPPGS